MNHCATCDIYRPDTDIHGDTIATCHNCGRTVTPVPKRHLMLARIIRYEQIYMADATEAVSLARVRNPGFAVSDMRWHIGPVSSYWRIALVKEEAA